jgi:hypothetical protein
VGLHNDVSSAPCGRIYIFFSVRVGVDIALTRFRLSYLDAAAAATPTTERRSVILAFVLE